MLKSAKQAYDIAIIGSGIVGTSSALQLARNNYKVVVIDTHKTPGFGTTSYSSAITRPCYTSLESIKTAFEAYFYLKNWRDFLKLPQKVEVAELQHLKCVIPITKNSAKFCNLSIPLMQKIGVPIEKLNVSETIKLGSKIGMEVENVYHPRTLDDPNFGVPEKHFSCQGSYIIHHCGYMNDPYLAARNMYQAASGKYGGEKLAHPAEFKFGQEVIEIALDHSKTSVTGLKLSSGESISAPIILNAGGPYSNKINQMAFVNSTLKIDNKVKTRVLRQEVAYLTVPKSLCHLKTDFPYLGFDFDNGCYYRPEFSSNKILVGSAEPDCDELQYIESDDPADIDYNLSDESMLHIYRSCLRFPKLPIPSSKQSQGIVSSYDVADDWTPIYDKSNLKGYYQAIGTSGNQFKNAGIIGKIVERIITDNENGINTDQQPSQMKLENLFAADKSDDLNFLNLGHFSRLRELTPGGNVMG